MLNIAVIGMGNVLMGDDGFGPYVIEVLKSRYEFQPSTHVMDVGTPGLDLSPYLGNVDAATKQTVMASGIAEALHNTFQGLFIAVICMMLHSFLSAKAALLIEEIDHASSEALDWVTLKAFGKLHEHAK